MDQCFRRSLLVVALFWGFNIAVGIMLLIIDRVDPSWAQYPTAAFFLIVGALGLLNYGFASRVCVTTNGFVWHDWFSLKSKRVLLSQLERITEESRQGLYMPFSVVSLRYVGGHFDLNPTVWNKSTIRRIIGALEERLPGLEVVESVRDLVQGTDLWIKR